MLVKERNAELSPTKLVPVHKHQAETKPIRKVMGAAVRKTRAKALSEAKKTPPAIPSNPAGRETRMVIPAAKVLPPAVVAAIKMAVTKVGVEAIKVAREVPLETPGNLTVQTRTEILAIKVIPQPIVITIKTTVSKVRAKAIIVIREVPVGTPSNPAGPETKAVIFAAKVIPPTIVIAIKRAILIVRMKAIIVAKEAHP